MRKPKPGDIVQVTFLDHVEDGNVPLECVVVGRLVSKGKILNKKRFVLVESWYFGSGVDKPTADANRKLWTILTSTVISMVRLVPDTEGANGV